MSAKKQAFDTERSSLFHFDPDRLVIIGLDTPDGPEHPLYDARALLPVDEGLVRDIMFHGVLQDIIITKVADIPYVVVGRQRVKAAREANRRLAEKGKMLIKVPCVKKQGTGLDLFGVLISENEHRTDDTPLAKARKAQKMLDMGASVERIATVFGVTEPAVRQWGKLLELPPEEQRAIEAGETTATATMTKRRAARVQREGGPRPGGRPQINLPIAVVNRALKQVEARVQFLEQTPDPDAPPEFRRGATWVLATLQGLLLPAAPAVSAPPANDAGGARRKKAAPVVTDSSGGLDLETPLDLEDEVRGDA